MSNRLRIPAPEMAVAVRLRQEDRLSWVEMEERLGYCAAVIQSNFRLTGVSARPLPIGGRHRWPEEREHRFLALIVGGMRVVKAGKMVGVGKNAAIGKWYRMRTQEGRNGGS